MEHTTTQKCRRRNKENQRQLHFEKLKRYAFTNNYHCSTKTPGFARSICLRLNNGLLETTMKGLKWPVVLILIVFSGHCYLRNSSLLPKKKKNKKKGVYNRKKLCRNHSTVFLQRNSVLECPECRAILEFPFCLYLVSLLPIVFKQREMGGHSRRRRGGHHHQVFQYVKREKRKKEKLNIPIFIEKMWTVSSNEMRESSNSFSGASVIIPPILYHLFIRSTTILQTTYSVAAAL